MPKLEQVVPHARRLVAALSAVAVVWIGSSAWANPCGGCAPAVACGPTTVEKTVYVPTWITQTRTIQQTCYRPERRERTVTVYRCVPETRAVERRYTVMVPQVRTKTQTYTVCVPVWNEVQRPYRVCVPSYENVQQQYTVLVPHRETRTATRTVCQMVPKTVTYTVCRNRGHWENRPYQRPCYSCGHQCGTCGACGGCGTITCMRRVWVPNIVQEQVQRTVYRPQYSKQPYQYQVVVCRPETRTRTVRVCRYHTETRSRTVRVCSYRTEQRQREVRYTVCVPQQRVKTLQLTSYRRVAEQKTVPYTVMVPYQTTKEVPVRVCQMVPKTITVPCAPYCGSGCYGGGRPCRVCR